MYSIKKQDDKFYIITPEGAHLKGWDGQPKWVGNSELAEKIIDRLNNPTVKKTAPQKIKGVMDNRHRNWKRRR